MSSRCSPCFPRFEYGGVVVMNGKAAAIRYVTSTWFIVDTISTVPGETASVF